MSRAIVIGSGGQDGQLLTARLHAHGVDVLGIGRPAGGEGDVDIRSADHVRSVVREFEPTEVYHLAACHHSSEQKISEGMAFYGESLDVNLMSLVHFLDAVRIEAPNCRLFYAASSRVFGHPEMDPVNERTPMNPICPYGIAKTAGLQYCRYFRSVHHVHASVGILFNHESSLRPSHYLSKRIIDGVLSIANGSRKKMVLGALKAGADWSYAEDAIEQIHLLMGLPQAGEYVIASGEWHTVEDFARLAFGSVGLDWKDHVVEESGVLREIRKPFAGDSSLFREHSGWAPKRTFEEMIRQLIVDSGGAELLQ